MFINWIRKLVECKHRYVQESEDSYIYAISEDEELVVTLFKLRCINCGRVKYEEIRTKKMIKEREEIVSIQRELSNYIQDTDEIMRASLRLHLKLRRDRVERGVFNG